MSGEMDRSTNETVIASSRDKQFLEDERTLVCTPTPLTCSSAIRVNQKLQRKPTQSFDGTFIPPTRSETPGPLDNECSDNDRTSLGILPSECLLGMSDSLLPLESHIWSHSSSSTHKNDSEGSSKEHTADSRECLPTVKKWPQGVKEKGNLVPQALFESVQEEDDGSHAAYDDSSQKSCSSVSHKTSDSGIGRAGVTSNYRSQSGKTSSNTDSGWQGISTDQFGASNNLMDFGEVERTRSAPLTAQDTMVPVSFTTPSLRSGTVEDDVLPVPDGEDGDHTVHQVALEADELQELEESFSDLGDSSEEENVPIVQDSGKSTSQERESAVVPDCSGNSSPRGNINMLNAEASPPQSSEALGLQMDGLFKKPMPYSSRVLSTTNEADSTCQNNEFCGGMRMETFSDSGSIGQIDNSQEHRFSAPSLVFASTVIFEQEPLNLNFTLDSSEHKDTHTRNPFEGHESYFQLGNPAGDFEMQEGAFGGFPPITGENEEFMDAGAAAAMLDQDEAQFYKENTEENQISDITLGSVRDMDETFLNMTIGTYMGTRSEPVGSLSDRRNRPDFGMVLKSPPCVRARLSEYNSNQDSTAMFEEMSEKSAKKFKEDELRVMDSAPDPDDPNKENVQSSSSTQIQMSRISDVACPDPVQNVTVDQTISDYTFSNVFKLLDNSEICQSDPTKLVLSAFNKRLEMQKAMKQVGRKDHRSRIPIPSSSVDKVRSQKLSPTDGCKNTEVSKAGPSRLSTNKPCPDKDISSLRPVRKELSETEVSTFGPSRSSTNKTCLDKDISSLRPVRKELSETAVSTFGPSSSSTNKASPDKGISSLRPDGKNLSETEVSKFGPSSSSTNKPCPDKDISSLRPDRIELRGNVPADRLEGVHVSERDSDFHASEIREESLSGNSTQNLYGGIAVANNTGYSFSKSRRTQPTPRAALTVSKDNDPFRLVNNSSLVPERTLLKDESVTNTLLLDSSESVLQGTEVASDTFASSTHIWGRPLDRAAFTQLAEKTIHPLVTPKQMCNIVELPNAVRIPEACCILLSQQTKFNIKNLLDQGVKCILSIREVTCNGQIIEPAMWPFEMKGRVTIPPHSSENVQVIFCPKDKGEFVACVEVFSQNLTSKSIKRMYTLTLSGYAEYPSLKIAPASEVLDFGDLLWGASERCFIKIQNVGRATVPLRFSISRTESPLCNFSFNLESNVSSISLTRRPPAVSNIYSISLPGKCDGDEAVTETVYVYCQVKEAQPLECKYLEKIQRFQAELLLELDTPIEGIALSKVMLRTQVGMFKLHLDKDLLSIACPPDKATGVGSLNVINSGNISMPVDIYLEPKCDTFSVSPNHMVVPCDGICQVQVTFTPPPTREDNKEYKVDLVLDNQLASYFASVCGKVVLKNTTIRGTLSVMEFGGVDIGESSKLKFSFIADNDTDVKIWFRKQGRAFKMMLEDGIPRDNADMWVRKGQKYTIWLVFSPPEVSGYTCDLVLQIPHGNRYTVPVIGYGGQCKVELSGISRADKGECWLDMEQIIIGKFAMKRISISNTGVRCCYLKAVFLDVGGLELPPHRATIVPSSIVVLPGDTIELAVMLSPSQKEMDLCRSGRALLALIKVMYGDEVTRQMVCRHPGKPPKPLADKFDIPLNGAQQKVVDAEVLSVQAPPDCFTSFKRAMTSVKLGVFGHRDDPSVHGTSSAFSRPNRMPLRSSQTQINPEISQPDTAKSTWALTPEELTFSGGEPEATAFAQIINFASKELRFVVDSDMGVQVSPNKGTVPAKNTTLLEIKFNQAFLTSQRKTSWDGLIKVECLQQTKLIRVKVSLPLHPTLTVNSNPALTKLADAVRQLPATSVSTTASTTATSSSSSTSISSVPYVGTPLHMRDQRSPRGKTPSTIQGSDMAIFPSSEAGTKTSVQYTIRNTVSESVQWEISPFAPPYVKHADSTQTVYRVNYDVFRLMPNSGTLQPNAVTTIFIEFRPQTKGAYNQAWCVQDPAMKEKHLHMFTVYAKALEHPSAKTAGFLPQGFGSSLIPTSPRQRGSHDQPDCHADGETSSGSTVAVGNSQGHSWQQVSDSMTGQGSDAVNLERTERSSSSDTKRHTKLSAPPSVSPSDSLTSSNQPNSSGDNISVRTGRTDSSKRAKPQIFQILQPHIHFGTLRRGESVSCKIRLENRTREDKQITVEHNPRPPFLIKQFQFTVSKSKTVLFPVTFKPLHVASFKDKVIFRETVSGNSHTAVLYAECSESGHPTMT